MFAESFASIYRVSRMPVAYIPRTRDLYNDFIPHRWVENDSAPFTPLTKPVSKIALMSSGGIMYRDQPRFHREDAAYRRIPRDARRDELSVLHFGQKNSAESEILSARLFP